MNALKNGALGLILNVFGAVYLFLFVCLFVFVPFFLFVFCSVPLDWAKHAHLARQPLLQLS